MRGLHAKCFLIKKYQQIGRCLEAMDAFVKYFFKMTSFCPQAGVRVNPRLKTISLFTGIGGLDLGMEPSARPVSPSEVSSEVSISLHQKFQVLLVALKLPMFLRNFTSASGWIKAALL